MPPEVVAKLSTLSKQIVGSLEFGNYAKKNGYALDPKGPEAISAEIIRDTKTFQTLLKELDQK